MSLNDRADAFQHLPPTCCGWETVKSLLNGLKSQYSFMIIDLSTACYLCFHKPVHLIFQISDKLICYISVFMGMFHLLYIAHRCPLVIASGAVFF